MSATASSRSISTSPVTIGRDAWSPAAVAVSISVGHHSERQVAVGDHTDGPAAVADHDGADVAVAHQLADVLRACRAPSAVTTPCVMTSEIRIVARQYRVVPYP